MKKKSSAAPKEEPEHKTQFPKDGAPIRWDDNTPAAAFEGAAAPVVAADKPKIKKKKEIPFRVKRWLTRNMAGCKKATGLTAQEIYDLLDL